MNWLYKLEKKFGRYYISRLMLILTVGSIFCLLLSMVFGTNFLQYLYLSPEKILEGQVWRLITFVFVTPSAGSILYIFAIYFYYIAGSALEDVWGEFKFNVYYLVSMLATIVVAFVSYFIFNNVGDSYLYLSATIMNLSIFLAYAKLFPDSQILLFFVVPVKIKWLGYFTWAIIGLNAVNFIISLNIGGMLLILIPVLNYLLFFGVKPYSQKNKGKGSVISMKDYKKKMKVNKQNIIHSCEICGVTNVDNPDMEFRYCSKCNGKHCYCEKHIMNHPHINK